MWTFDRSSGGLDHDGVLCGFGYSGHGAGINNPAMEQVHNVGPIPAGKWRIGPFFHHAEKGPLCADLTPIEGTDAFGRTGFLIHGDNAQMNRSASKVASSWGSH
jgi:hypothetical protein